MVLTAHDWVRHTVLQHRGYVGIFWRSRGDPWGYGGDGAGIRGTWWGWRGHLWGYGGDGAGIRGDMVGMARACVGIWWGWRGHAWGYAGDDAGIYGDVVGMARGSVGIFWGWRGCSWGCPGIYGCIMNILTCEVLAPYGNLLSRVQTEGRGVGREA